MNLQDRLKESKALNLAHRGFTAAAPENSMAAFARAFELGVDGVELDVRLCGSGDVIVFHDAYLSRMTDGAGFVKKKTLAELQKLSLKSRGRITDQQIPSLEDAAGLVAGNSILNVEIKSNGSASTGLERKVLKTLHDVGVIDQAVISSFNPVVLRRVRKLSAEITTGLLLDKNITLPSIELMLMKLTKANGVHLSGKLAKEQLITKIRRLGFFSFVWTVNEPRAMQRLINMGVNGIITDRPDLMLNKQDKESLQ